MNWEQPCGWGESNKLWINVDMVCERKGLPREFYDQIMAWLMRKYVQHCWRTKGNMKRLKRGEVEARFGRNEKRKRHLASKLVIMKELRNKRWTKRKDRHFLISQTGSILIILHRGETEPDFYFLSLFVEWWNFHECRFFSLARSSRDKLINRFPLFYSFQRYLVSSR